MDFNEQQPIFRQIEDYCQQRIVGGAWHEGERIPSTKELALDLSVNNRTVMKAYDSLAEKGVIYQRRGLGYYVADGAMELIMKLQREEFMKVSVPEIARKMRELNISLDDLTERLRSL